MVAPFSIVREHEENGTSYIAVPEGQEIPVDFKLTAEEKRALRAAPAEAPTEEVK